MLTRIGVTAGSIALYQAMTRLGHAAGTDFVAPPTLNGAKSGTSVLVLGAGLAGMLAAYELRKAGYTVRILEFQKRSGGRNITLRGGDTLTELGGATQTVAFAPGNYINPGPWRIPYHHRAILHYCKQFGVALEPFTQLNHNAWLHSSQAFGGKPQRYRDFVVDFAGYTAELLAKAVHQKALDAPMSEDEQHDLLTSLRLWGDLDIDFTYRKSLAVSHRRGFDKPRGGGPEGMPTASDLLPRDQIMKSGFAAWQGFFLDYDMQTTMFQPVGGMDNIGKGFSRQVGDLVTHNIEVRKIAQDDKGVTVSYIDQGNGGTQGEAQADYCVCTIPLPVLSQLDIQVGAPMKNAIEAVPYASSVKIGLEFRRRFWEQDDAIYGGISFTDQPISQISYPSHGFFEDGPAVLLGGYMFGPAAYDFAGMLPEQRVEQALQQGAKLHKNYYREFVSGVGVAWSRMPWTLGCCSLWSEESRKLHYKALTEMDGRIVLAGEHASTIGCWQEGALLSALSAITRLHQRALGAA